MYGIEGHELVRHTRHIRPRNTMKSAEAHDVLVVDQEELVEALALPAYLYRETLQPVAGADVVATYEGDGAPGLVVKEFGKGKAIYCGVLAGMAYLTPAMTASSQILPTAFDERIRDSLAGVPSLARVVRPVETSDPLVEAQYFTGPNGDIVVLINWRDEPVEDLVVRFPGRPDIKAVRSLRQAGYFQGHLHEQERGEIEVTAPLGTREIRLKLDVSDYLLING